MKVLIVDVDWFNHLRFTPNMLCMQLSSYHKQLRDEVSIGLEKYQISMSYDLIYLVRETIDGGLPPIKITDKKVKLIGNGFKFFTNYTTDLPEVINACAPDYSIYPRTKEKRDRANYVRLTTTNGTPLPEIQNYHGFKGANITIITDDKFWDLTDEQIKKLLKQIFRSELLGFQKSIDINKFIKHNLQDIFKGRTIYAREFKFCGNLINKRDVKKLIDDLNKIKFTYKGSLSVNVGTITVPHGNSNGLAYMDFERCLEIAHYAKRNKININFDFPDRRDSPLWFIFEELGLWSEYDFKHSFVEHMLMSACAQHKVPIEELIRHSTWFNTVPAKMLLDIVENHKPMIEKYGFSRWGRRNLPYIDLSKIERKRKI